MRRMQPRLPGGLARALRGAARGARPAARGERAPTRSSEAAVARSLREDAQAAPPRVTAALRAPFCFPDTSRSGGFVRKTGSAAECQNAPMRSDLDKLRQPFKKNRFPAYAKSKFTRRSAQLLLAFWAMRPTFLTPQTCSCLREPRLGALARGRRDITRRLDALGRAIARDRRFFCRFVMERLAGSSRTRVECRAR